MMPKNLLLLAILLINFASSSTVAKHNLLSAKTINGFQSNVVQISIPKCGTHLLWRLIGELTGRTMKFWKSGQSIKDWGKLSHVSLEDATILSSLGPNYLWLTHTVYTDELYTLLQKNNCKIIFIYRDPRDQIVSSAYFLKKRNPKVLSLTPISELITRLILDGPPLPDKNITPGIANMYYSRIQWKECPEVCSLCFEDLTSNDAHVQLNTLRKLANYLEVSVTDETLSKIIASVFGKGVTFRKGTTGEWKQHFTEEQKNLVKQEIGPLLIELEYE